MKVRNFIVADAVAQGPGGKMFIHGGGLTSVVAPRFPYAQPRLGLLVTLVYDRPEDDVGHQQVRVVLEDDQGQEVTRLIDHEAEPPPEPFAERKSNALLHMVGEISGLSFATPGRYWVVLSLDGEELDRMMLDVIDGTVPDIG